MDGDLLKQISIPVFTGVIGYVINWTGGRFKFVIRRSIHLTPLGGDFCELSLPLDTAEFEAVQPHQVPPEA
jgi:hypothetical protein